MAFQIGVRELIENSHCRMPACVQAAASIMKGVASGKYNIRTPDFFSNILISGTMASLTPRMFPLILEVFLAPLTVVGSAVFRYLIDREVLKVRKVTNP